MRRVYEQEDVRRAMAGLTDRVAAAFEHEKRLNIVGIRTRGEILAERIAGELARRGFANLGRGVLDVTLYRDDLSDRGPGPMVRPTDVPAEMDGHPLLLVDDVLFTGRSIRAAMDLLSDFGRPGAIRLAVLVDRCGRELPIQADFVGLTMADVPADHRVNVRLVETDGRDEILVQPRGEAEK